MTEKPHHGGRHHDGKEREPEHDLQRQGDEEDLKLRHQPRQDAEADVEHEPIDDEEGE